MGERPFARQEVRDRVIRERFSNERNQGEFELIKTDFLAVLDDVRQALDARGYDPDYDVQGSTSADIMVRGPVNGKRIHVRVDMVTVLS